MSHLVSVDKLNPVLRHQCVNKRPCRTWHDFNGHLRGLVRTGSPRLSLGIAARASLSSRWATREVWLAWDFRVKHKHRHHEPLTPERLLPAPAAVASDEAKNPIIPSGQPDDAVIRYVRELAKRHAREDHEAEIEARQASHPATSERP